MTDIHARMLAKPSFVVTRIKKNGIIGHSDSVRSVAISPNGQTIVSGSADNTIKIWRLER